MSMWKGYVERVMEKATKAFVAYIDADNELQKAMKRKSEYPINGTVRQDYYEKAIEAAHAANKAQKTFDEAKQGMNETLGSIRSIRREFVESVMHEFTPNGGKIKDNDVKLFESGILTADEIIRMYDEYSGAENWTMVRVCGKYAKQYADRMASDAGLTASVDEQNRIQNLNAIATDAAQDRAGAWIEPFDLLVDTFARTIDNPALIQEWSSLTAPVVELF